MGTYLMGYTRHWKECFIDKFTLEKCTSNFKITTLDESDGKKTVKIIIIIKIISALSNYLSL